MRLCGTREVNVGFCSSTDPRAVLTHLTTLEQRLTVAHGARTFAEVAGVPFLQYVADKPPRK